jgi:hypothetical protein
MGEPIPKLNEKDHVLFLLHLQKAALLSLKERNLLTNAQYTQCVSRLEQEHNEKSKKQRRA